MIDYIVVAGSLENRVCESTSHLHEHFKEVIDISGGTYKVPTQAGYAEMIPASMDEFEYPTGTLWAARVKEGKE
jgi:L-fuconate dehydratase